MHLRLVALAALALSALAHPHPVEHSDSTSSTSLSSSSTTLLPSSSALSSTSLPASDLTAPLTASQAQALAEPHFSDPSESANLFAAFPPEDVSTDNDQLVSYLARHDVLVVSVEASSRQQPGETVDSFGWEQEVEGLESSDLGSSEFISSAFVTSVPDGGEATQQQQTEVEVVLRASKEVGGAADATSWAISASSREGGGGDGAHGASSAALGALVEASRERVLPLALAALRTPEPLPASPGSVVSLHSLLFGEGGGEGLSVERADAALLAFSFLLCGVFLGKWIATRERRAAEEAAEEEEEDEEAGACCKPRSADAGTETEGACWSAHLMEAPFM